MAKNLPLHEMSVPEKLRMMEELWEDLSRKPADIKSPKWHGTVLDERERCIAKGSARFIP